MHLSFAYVCHLPISDCVHGHDHAHLYTSVLYHSFTWTHTHTAAASVWFKIVLLIVQDTVGSAPQVIFYCSHSSIRAMLLPVLPDSCYITASLCVLSLPQIE